MAATLTDAVKRKLNITWSDDITDSSIADLIDDAGPVMIHKLGIAADAFDFATPGMERDLFLEYCLYKWCHEAQLFDDNYRTEIDNVRAVWAMKGAVSGE